MMSDKVRESIQVALEQLHDERERIEGAIAKLEGFLGNLVNSATTSIRPTSKPTSRGRTAAAAPRKAARERVVAKQRSREGWTDEARSAAAERMRKYWAERRDAAAEGKDVSRKNSRSRKADRTRPANELAANDSKERSRKGWTEEAREAARERMRKYWAERKNEGATG